MAVSQPSSTQLNIRSRFACERAAALAAHSGMTITQVIEEALRCFHPPVERSPAGFLVRKGALLVKPSDQGRISLQDANLALEEVRTERQ